VSNFRALTIQSGVHKQQQDADTLIVGAGITTNSGNLTISAAGTDVVLAAGKNLSVGSGAGNIDFSASTGAFKTPTGAVTIGPGAISVSGNMTMQAGTVLGTTGSGNINLPNNGSARFQIEGSSVSANVTAANLNTLTGGSSSVADSLHTHSNIAQLGITGFTTTGLGDGDFAYVSSANTVSKTDSASISTSKCIGANEGTVGAITCYGVIENAKFTTAGGSPSVGAAVWLAALTDDSNAGAGKLTATAPSAGVVAEIGIVLDNANYAGSKTSKVLLQIKSPVVL